MSTADSWSRTWTFFEGEWHEGNVPIMGPRTHAAWLCSIVFDGARAFEGVTPDLELHCARVSDSAAKLFLKPTVSTETWVGLAREGIKKFDRDVALYIRPMYWAEKEGPWVQAHDPESTRWCLAIYEAPLRTPRGFSVTISPYRRPTLETMPVDAKAGCLYPNNARALFEAHSRGFDNAIVCDMLGNDRFGRGYLLPAHCQRLLRYRPQRINIVKIDALYLVHGRIDIARNGDIDDEKRTIDAIGQRGSQICWGQ